jgi:Mn2+/Fe2+ NRAMP family transporter
LTIGVSELLGWRASLESKPRHARKFYYVLSAATILGVCLNFLGMDPIRALFLSAVVNGIVAVPLMFLLMLVSQKPAIVGKFVLPRYLRLVGWIATGVMLVASLGFLVTAAQQLLAR